MGRMVLAGWWRGDEVREREGYDRKRKDGGEVRGKEDFESYTQFQKKKKL